MSVVSLEPGYSGPVRDVLANFHGNQLVYVHWEGHLNFCSAITLPLPPAMPFKALAGEVMPSLYGKDPDWQVDELDAIVGEPLDGASRLEAQAARYRWLNHPLVEVHVMLIQRFRVILDAALFLEPRGRAHYHA